MTTKRTKKVAEKVGAVAPVEAIEPPMAMVYEAPACPGCEARFDRPPSPFDTDRPTDVVEVTCAVCGQRARARFWRRQEA